MFRVLYITYDGLTDPLGRSQILPYLVGLSKEGCDIQIVSAEKETNFNIYEQQVREQIKDLNIHWVHTNYSNRPPLLSTFLLIKRIKKLAHTAFTIKHFNIVHCRSLIPAMIGLALKNKYGSKLIFDIRGFWADERVEGGLWNLKNPIYKLLYKYFKQQEKKIFSSADGIVSLTNKAKEYIQNHFKAKAHFAVIPCSVDTVHFNPLVLSEESKQKLRLSLGLNANDYVLIYLGSLGTRYLLNEMLHFFKVIRSQKADVKMLFVTNTPKEFILREVNKEGIEANNIIITASNYTEIPKYISLANAGIFFIYTGFSGKAVSPTKQSELLAMGIPIVANKGVGDIEMILRDPELGVLLQDFEESSMTAAVKQLLQTDYNQQYIINKAKKMFALEKAIETYFQLYSKL